MITTNTAKQKIVIAAANGFIGGALMRYFSHYQIIALVRTLPTQTNAFNHVRYVHWDGKTPGAWVNEVENSIAVVNLAGKSVNCRYTKKNKAAIFASRIQSTQAIGKAIQACKNPPKVWFNAGSATIYRHSLDKPMTEENGEYHNDFSVQVCKAWEQTFNAIETPNTRKVFLRIAIVLGKGGGVFETLKQLAKVGLGGKHGNGKQMVSWIHENDLCRAIEFVLQKPTISGIVNCAAPVPVQNAMFMRSLRRALNIGFGLPQPVFLLRLGTWFMRTEKELVMKSRYVLPDRLLNEGFEFNLPNIEKALHVLTQKDT